jgi:hypothetical protein
LVPRGFFALLSVFVATVVVVAIAIAIAIAIDVVVVVVAMVGVSIDRFFEFDGFCSVPAREAAAAAATSCRVQEML